MILPSRTFGAARGDPGGGEIPMRQNALPEGAFPVFGASWTNTGIKQKTIDTTYGRSAAKQDHRISFKLLLPTVFYLKRRTI